jgi:PHD/YefM family antitoxin component YafN of YafNO toxin-antitoxin module
MAKHSPVGLIINGKVEVVIVGKQIFDSLEDRLEELESQELFDQAAARNESSIPWRSARRQLGLE